MSELILKPLIVSGIYMGQANLKGAFDIAAQLTAQLTKKNEGYVFTSDEYAHYIIPINLN